MADVIDYKIHGDDMQIVEVELDSGEAVRAEAGAMMFMEDGIEMETGASGGLMGGLKRMVTGESFFITSFTYQGEGKGHVAFGAPYPGKIIERNLAVGESLRVDTGCLVGLAPTVDYDIQMLGGFRNMLFGGEGLFFARLTGPGKVYLQGLPFSRLADRISAASGVGGSEVGEERSLVGRLLGD